MEVWFEGLTCLAPRKKKRLLDDVTGRFLPGELTAIMGPSGAGKTTLLNAISGYSLHSKYDVMLRGRLMCILKDYEIREKLRAYIKSFLEDGKFQVKVGSYSCLFQVIQNGTPQGFPLNQLCRRSGVRGKIVKGSRRSFCYIAQEDIVDPMLTAGELMEFASRLKLPANYTTKQRSVVIENLITSIGLEECVNTRTQNLSGGERKRLSIALELVSNPPILFLDEPTSGLDTVSTGHLIRLLNRLSKDGRTIVVTIHQPSASLLDLFDRVYLLAKGKCVYQGGSGSHLLKFLAINGFICPIHHNPADYVIELTEDKRNVNILCEAANNGRTSWYLGSEGDKGSDAKLETISKRRISENSFSEYKPRSCESFWIQFSTIFSRIILQEKRNRTGLKLQFYHHLCCSLALGIMFFKNANDGTEFFPHLKLCMAITIFQAYTMQTVPMLYYPFEVKLLEKEHFNKWYSLFPYYLAFTAAKAPVMVTLNLLDCFIVYSMVGLPWDLDRFTYFVVIGLMIGFVADGLGHTIGSLFSATNSCAIGPFTLAPFIGLATYGFDFMKTIHPLMDALVQTSYVRSGIVANILILYGLDRKELYCPDNVDYCLYKDPREAFHYLTLDRFSIPLMMLHLLINFCLFRVTFYLALKWRLKK